MTWLYIHGVGNQLIRPLPSIHRGLNKTGTQPHLSRVVSQREVVDHRTWRGNFGLEVAVPFSLWSLGEFHTLSRSCAGRGRTGAVITCHEGWKLLNFCG